MSGTSTPATPATTAVTHHNHKVKYEVPYLDNEGSDYGQWSFCSRLVLQSRDLWDVVDGTSTCPARTTDPDAYKAWMQKDRDAMIQISTSLKKGPFNVIAGASSSKECWDKLTDRFRGKGEQRVAYLMESLFHSAISESEALEPQIEKLREAARNLDSLGFGLSDKVLAFVIVMALPESMSTMKTILYNTTGAALTSDNIIAQILNDEQRRIRSSGLEVTAFYSKASAAGKKQRKKCTHCNIRGHDVSECRKLKAKRDAKTSSGGKKPKALPAPSSAKVAKAGSDSDASDTDGPTVYHTSVTEQGLIATEHALTSRDIQGHWIVDSGASRTMCSHRDWFHSFEALQDLTDVFCLGEGYRSFGMLSGNMHPQDPR